MCYSIFKPVAGAHDFKGYAQRVKALLGFLKQLAPYAAIELVLPGGTLLALLLWFYQRRKAASRRTADPDLLTAGSLGVGHFSAFHLSRG